MGALKSASDVIAGKAPVRSEDIRITVINPSVGIKVGGCVETFLAALGQPGLGHLPQVRYIHNGAGAACFTGHIGCLLECRHSNDFIDPSAIYELPAERIGAAVLTDNLRTVIDGVGYHIVNGLGDSPAERGLLSYLRSTKRGVISLVHQPYIQLRKLRVSNDIYSDSYLPPSPRYPVLNRQ